MVNKQRRIRNPDDAWAEIEGALNTFIATHFRALNPTRYHLKRHPRYIGRMIADDGSKLYINVECDSCTIKKRFGETCVRITSLGFGFNGSKVQRDELVIDIEDPQSFDKIADWIQIVNSKFWMGEARYCGLIGRASVIQKISTLLAEFTPDVKYHPRIDITPEYLTFNELKGILYNGVLIWKTKAGSEINRSKLSTLCRYNTDQFVWEHMARDLAKYAKY